MAIGDAAGAAGLKVYDDSLLVTDVDQALNQRADELAKVMGRVTTVEQASVGTPMFSVGKSTNGQTLDHDTAAIFRPGAWGRPTINEGFTWSTGALQVTRPGIYGVAAMMKMTDNDFYAISVMITKNSEGTSSGAAIARDVVYPGQQGGYKDPLVSPTSRAENTLVALNNGDVLRVVGFQRNRNGNSVRLDDAVFSLTLEVEWKRDLPS